MIKVAFQGRRGAYSERAAIQVFGGEIEFKTCNEFEDVYKAVENDEVEFGVLPIENSTAGAIYDNYDLLLKYQIPIIAETEVHVEHVLMACESATMNTIKEVYSHPQALAQCSHFFDKHKHIKKVPAFDTAGSAEQVSIEGDSSKAAIAGENAAQQYNLKVIKYNLENLSGKNYTRFFVISKNAKCCNFDFGVADKTTIVFSAAKEMSGFLHRALGFFAKNNINLVKIESRPLAEKPWEYSFYIDFEGSAEDEKVKESLEGIEKITDFLYILGSYASA